MSGEVVVVPSPFSDLSQTKRRPALVVASLAGRDLILCQITSQHPSDPHAIALALNDFEHGGLDRESYVRCGRTFTAEESIILRSAGVIRQQKLSADIDEIVEILTGSGSVSV